MPIAEMTPNAQKLLVGEILRILARQLPDFGKILLEDLCEMASEDPNNAIIDEAIKIAQAL
jgi:hypothetical protein